MEFVDLYDENRIPLGRTAQRYSRREKGTYRLIVHVLEWVAVPSSRGSSQYHSCTQLFIQSQTLHMLIPSIWNALSLALQSN